MWKETHDTLLNKQPKLYHSMNSTASSVETCAILYVLKNMEW